MDDTIAELSLTELISDPVIGLLMKSDGVDRRNIELLFERLAERRNHSSRPLSAPHPTSPARTKLEVSCPAAR
jgi:hypothetical protein